MRQCENKADRCPSRALPKAPGRDIWHSDAALLGFVAVQQSQGKITFRIRTDKNHSLRVGTWSTTLTSTDARELAKTKLREHLVEPAVACPKITLGKYVEEYYAPQYRLRHASEKSLNNLNQLQLDDTLLRAIEPQLVKTWMDQRLRAGKKPGSTQTVPRRFGRGEIAIRAWRPSTSGRTFADVVKPLILTAMNTGLRQGELFNLTWEDYADGAREAWSPRCGSAWRCSHQALSMRAYRR
jgi:integrase